MPHALFKPNAQIEAFSCALQKIAMKQPFSSTRFRLDCRFTAAQASCKLVLYLFNGKLSLILHKCQVLHVQLFISKEVDGHNIPRKQLTLTGFH